MLNDQRRSQSTAAWKCQSKKQVWIKFWLFWGVDTRNLAALNTMGRYLYISVWCPLWVKSFNGDPDL